MRVSKRLLGHIYGDLRRSQSEGFPQVFSVCGKRYLLLKHVFSPIVYDSTEFFAANLPYPPGEGFFEVGTGTGAIAVTALLRGCTFAKGIDVNKSAVRNARLNAELHGVEAKACFCLKDIGHLNSFGASRLVFWAHPWVNAAQSGKFGVLERSLLDPGYQGLRSYLALARGAPGARVFLGFGNTGDYVALRRLCKRFGLRPSLHKDCDSSMGKKYTYQLLELRLTG